MGQSNNCCVAAEREVDEHHLYLSELDVLKLTKIPLEHIQRKNVVFSFRDAQIVSVRTFIFSDESVF